MPNNAIREQLRQFGENLRSESEDTVEETEVTDTDESVEEEDTADEADVDTEESTEDSEDPAAEVTEDDVPTKFFEVDLSGLPSDQRQAILDRYAKDNDYIQKLLRNRAEDEPAKEDAPAEDAPDDAEFIKVLGLDDPDDPYAEHTAKVAVPLAKMLAEALGRLENLETSTQVERTERYWETQLDTLEKKYGDLPVSRDAVYKLAAEAGIAEPLDAYWRIQGPLRQEVQAEVEKRRAALVGSQKKGAKGAQRPRAEASASEKPLKLGEDVKDVKQAMKLIGQRIAKEKGLPY